MIFALDDVVWQSLINGGYAMIGAAFVAYLNYKLNAIQAVQKTNAEKVSATAEKAAITAEKVQQVAQDQKDHLAAQDVTLKKIVEQTNGLTTALVEAASKSGFQAGHDAASNKG
jgi:hypothetical protein